MIERARDNLGRYKARQPLVLSLHSLVFFPSGQKHRLSG
jgi:hypothetical protein